MTVSTDRSAQGLDILLTPVLAPIAIVVRAWVVTTIWAWLLIPPFRLPPLPLSAAVGGILILQLADHTSVMTKEEREKSTVERCLVSLCISLFGLVIAWVTKLIAY